MLKTLEQPGNLSIAQIQVTAANLAAELLAPGAERIDREAQGPEANLRALGEAGLWGLNLPRACGGLGQGMLALAVVNEELGAACSSTAMCFGMHCVAAKVLSAKATKHQMDHYLRPIAQGRHLTTPALTEPETAPEAAQTLFAVKIEAAGMAVAVTYGALMLAGAPMVAGCATPRSRMSCRPPPICCKAGLAMSC